MGLDESTPRQVAPSVGKNSAGLEVSPVPTANGKSPITPANGNSPISSANGNSPAMSANGNSPIQAIRGDSPTYSKSGGLPASPAKSTSAHLMNFNPHSPDLQEAFSGLESGLDLTVGAFNFFHKQSWHAGLDRSATTGAGRTRGSVDCARPVVDS